MSDRMFALFDTAIGECGVVWGETGIVGVQLPMAGDDRTRLRIRQSHGDIPEGPPPPAVRDAIGRMTELLRGRPVDLGDIVLDLSASPEFNRNVYAIARTIAPGKSTMAPFHPA